MQILVVDDSKTIRRILCRILQEAGYKTFEASHGGEALQLLEQLNGIELVLIDWNMPEISGFDFVCTVRSQRTYDNIQLIMVSTEVEMAQMAKALKAGANEYIMKPFTKEIVLEKLNILRLLS